jgi:hypothetical protein
MDRSRRRMRLEQLESRTLLAATIGIPDLVLDGDSPDSQFVASVEIANAPGVRAATVEIHYDQTLLQADLDSVRAGSIWDGKAVAIANVNESEGTITAFVFATEDMSLSSGSLLDIDFLFNDDTVGTARANISVGSLRLNEGDIPVSSTPIRGQSAIDGSITRKASAESTQSAAAPTRPQSHPLPQPSLATTKPANLPDHAALSEHAAAAAQAMIARPINARPTEINPRQLQPAPTQLDPPQPANEPPVVAPAAAAPINPPAVPVLLTAPVIVPTTSPVIVPPRTRVAAVSVDPRSPVAAPADPSTSAEHRVCTAPLTVEVVSGPELPATLLLAIGEAEEVFGPSWAMEAAVDFPSSEGGVAAGTTSLFAGVITADEPTSPAAPTLDAVADLVGKAKLHSCGDVADGLLKSRKEIGTFGPSHASRRGAGVSATQLGLFSGRIAEGSQLRAQSEPSDAEDALESDSSVSDSSDDHIDART